MSARALSLDAKMSYTLHRANSRAPLSPGVTRVDRTVEVWRGAVRRTPRALSFIQSKVANHVFTENLSDYLNTCLP